MRQAIFLLYSTLTFTSVFSGYPDEHDHIHQPDYPVVIPSQRFVKVHSAENTEIGSQPPPPPPGQGQQGQQWGGPTKYGSDDDDSHHHHHHDEEKPTSNSKRWSLPPLQRYGYPPKCLNDYLPKNDDNIDIYYTKCRYMVIIAVKSQKVGHDVYKYAHFKMSSKMDKPYGYVAVGLSKDDKMDDDHIVECVKPSDTVHPRMYHSWSNFHSMPTRLADNSHIIKNKSESFDAKNNILTCEFDRPLVTTVEYVKGNGPVKQQVFDLTKEKYKILMAVGEPAKPDSDVLGQHGPRKLGTVSIFDPAEYYSRSSSSSLLNSAQEFLTIFIMFAISRVML